ncbi:MAG TPA: autotransporter-associated beta strand repeat-containing protein [Tepidisphaeraceae bacterium]
MQQVHQRVESRRSRRSRQIQSAVLAASAIASVGTLARAQSLLYWDLNGNTANSGTTVSNNWNSTNTFWNSAAAGTGGTISAWQPGNVAVFASGTNATGNNLVTVVGQQSVAGLQLEDGTWTLSTSSALAGSFAMPGSSFTITNAIAGKQHAINVPITGAGSVYVNNTSTGNLNLNFDTQMNFGGNLEIGSGIGFTSTNTAALTTRVQLGYALPSTATIRMRNNSELGSNTVQVDPVTGVNTPAGYVLSNNIQLNVDNLATAHAFFGGANGRTITYSGVISSPTGAGQLSHMNFSLQGSGGRAAIILTNQSTYQGDTFVNLTDQNGLLKFGINNALPVTTNMNFGGQSNGGTQNTNVAPVDLGGYNQQWASLQSQGSGRIQGIFNSTGSSTLTISGTRSSTFGGTIGAAAPSSQATTAITGNSNITLVKGGASTLRLNAQQLYTGDTIINGGILQTGFSSSAGASTLAFSGNVFVNNGGTFATTGSSQATNFNLGASVTVNSGGVMSPALTNTATVSIPFDLTLNNGGALNLDVKALEPDRNDQLLIGNSFNLEAGGSHIVNVGVATGGAMAVGDYTLAQYVSRSWDGINGVSLGTTPGGNFNYSLEFGDNFLVLHVLPTGSTYRWSVGSTSPATEGAGTWSDGGGNFIDIGNSNVAANWNNTTYTGDVIFGGDNQQGGGIVTLGSAINVNGTLRFSPVQSGAPYTIGAGAGSPTLTLNTGVFSATPATIDAPVTVGNNTTWNILGSSVSLTVNQALSQAAGQTATLTKSGTGVLVFKAPVTLGSMVVSGGAVESWHANGLTSVPAISLDGGAALRAMVAQVVPGNINVGTGGGLLTVTGDAGTATMSGVITAAGNVTKQGGGTLILTNPANSIASWTLTGSSNGFQSNVRFSNPAAFGTGAVNINGGGLVLDAPMNLVNNLSLTATGTLGTSSIINQGDNNLTLSGIISGSGDLHKKGGGTLTISGANTYQGGAFYVDDPSRVITTNSKSLGNATFWPNAAMTLEVQQDLTTAYWRGSGTVTKVGTGKIIAGAVGNVPAGFNEGASIVVNQGAIQLNAAGAFGGRMDVTGNVAGTTGAGSQPQATHRQYDITANSGTEVIANYVGDRYGGSLTLNNATMSRPAGVSGDAVFTTYNTWTLGTTSTSSAVTTNLNYGSMLTVTGNSTIRSQDTAAQTAGNTLALTMPVNVTSGSTLTVSNANAGGYDNSNVIVFRGVPNANYNSVADAIQIQPNASIVTTGPGQVRFGRQGSDGKIIIGNGNATGESLLKVSSNTYFTDYGGPTTTLLVVNGAGDRGLRIEAPMNATYTDRSADVDPTHHEGTTGLFGVNTTSTSETGTAPTNFSKLGNAFSVMSAKRLNGLSASTGGTITLAATDNTPGGATGTIDNGPSTATPLKLALDNTPASGNLTYNILPNANGGNFKNFGGLVVKNSNPSAGKVTAKMPNANSTFRVKTLSIQAGAALDLTDNDLIVDNGNFADIIAKRWEGYRDAPDSTATGIISSAGQTITGAPILAVFDNSIAQFSDWPFGSGETIGNTAVVGQFTYIGDADLNGQVTPDDYGAIDSNLGQHVGTAEQTGGMNWFAGDWNFDGDITPDDYGAVDANLGNGQTQGPQLSASGLMAANGLAAVPEPTSLGLLGVAGVGMLVRRRRRA